MKIGFFEGTILLLIVLLAYLNFFGLPGSLVNSDGGSMVGSSLAQVSTWGPLLLGLIPLAVVVVAIVVRRYRKS